MLNEWPFLAGASLRAPASDWRHSHKRSAKYCPQLTAEGVKHWPRNFHYRNRPVPAPWPILPTSAQPCAPCSHQDTPARVGVRWFSFPLQPEEVSHSVSGGRSYSERGLVCFETNRR